MGIEMVGYNVKLHLISPLEEEQSDRIIDSQERRHRLKQRNTWKEDSNICTLFSVGIFDKDTV